jgi:hypothetical protein
MSLMILWKNDLTDERSIPSGWRLGGKIHMHTKAEGQQFVITSRGRSCSGKGWRDALYSIKWYCMSIQKMKLTLASEVWALEHLGILAVAA